MNKQTIRGGKCIKKELRGEVRSEDKTRATFFCYTSRKKVIDICFPYHT